MEINRLAVPLNGFFDSLPFAMLAKERERGSLYRVLEENCLSVFFLRISVLKEFKIPDLG